MSNLEDEEDMRNNAIESVKMKWNEKGEHSGLSQSTQFLPLTYQRLMKMIKRVPPGTTDATDN